MVSLVTSCWNAGSIPEPTDTLENWWLNVLKPFNKKNKRLFDAFIILIAWSLWKQRNARLFNNVSQQLTVTVLVDRIVDEFNIWQHAGVGGREMMTRE